MKWKASEVLQLQWVGRGGCNYCVYEPFKYAINYKSGHSLRLEYIASDHDDFLNQPLARILRTTR